MLNHTQRHTDRLFLSLIFGYKALWFSPATHLIPAPLHTQKHLKSDTACVDLSFNTAPKK